MLFFSVFNYNIFFNFEMQFSSVFYYFQSFSIKWILFKNSLSQVKWSEIDFRMRKTWILLVERSIWLGNVFVFLILLVGFLSIVWVFVFYYDLIRHFLTANITSDLKKKMFSTPCCFWRGTKEIYLYCSQFSWLFNVRIYF